MDASTTPGSLRLIAGKLRGAAAQLRYLPRAATLAWDAAGLWSPLWIGLLCAQGLVPVAIVYLSRPLVDDLAAAVGPTRDDTHLASALLVAATIAAVMLASEILRSAAEYARAVQARRVEDHVHGLIHRKSVAVDLGFYETP